MIIIGIDPGTSNTGYGVIEVAGNRVSYVDCGVIHISDKLAMPEKLVCIYDGLTGLMRKHGPGRVSIEEAFYAKNVHTTLVLGQARGVALLAAMQSGADVAEYSPREIKKTMTGNGNAAKNQVEYMVKMLVRAPAAEHHADAFDALAAALCDFRYQAFQKKMDTARR
jgi:crossover junction endodeoxyribonuclease RuvC